LIKADVLLVESLMKSIPGCTISDITFWTSVGHHLLFSHNMVKFRSSQRAAFKELKEFLEKAIPKFMSGGWQTPTSSTFRITDAGVAGLAPTDWFREFEEAFQCKFVVYEARGVHMRRVPIYETEFDVGGCDVSEDALADTNNMSVELLWMPNGSVDIWGLILDSESLCDNFLCAKCGMLFRDDGSLRSHNLKTMCSRIPALDPNGAVRLKVDMMTNLPDFGITHLPSRTTVKERSTARFMRDPDLNGQIRTYHWDSKTYIYHIFQNVTNLFR
jgi:hypothetical protein